MARHAGQVVGIADLEMFRQENTHVARVDVRVLPEHRRRGVGRVLVEGAERLARASRRSELGGMDETPNRPDYVDAAGPFARRLGFSVVLAMVRRGLRLPLNPSTPRAPSSPRRRARRVLAGYVRRPVARPFLADRCELGRRMSTDVPVGEQELDEEVWDEARVRAIEAGMAAQHRAKVTTAAREDASGRLVGFTEVVVPSARPSRRGSTTPW